MISMKQSNLFNMASLAAVLFLPSMASAFQVYGTLDFEAAFEAFQDAGATVSVVAEGRIGDLAGAAEHEFNIHFDKPTGGQDVVTEYRAYDWPNSGPVAWTVKWDGIKLIYIIGGQTLEYEPADKSITAAFIRTTAREDQSSIVVNNLKVDGDDVGGTSSFACIGGCGYYDGSQYLVITGLDTPFEMTGVSTMSWKGDARDLSDKTAPHRSELAFQIKLGTPPPVVPMTGGDPHFKGWLGDMFDYHGICDLVFLHAPDFGQGLGLDIHIRTKPRFQYSYIESAAIRIGDDILEISSFGEYRFNGVLGAEMPLMMASQFPVQHEQINKKRHSFEIQLEGRENIVIATNKDLVSVKMGNATSVSFGTSSGMMGNYKTGKMLGRDGKTILVDPNEFGQEWQVLQTEPKLFDDAQRYPQAPVKCIAPDSAERTSRRLGESRISEEAAKKACSHWGEDKDLCVYDVMAMGDLELADAGAF